MRLTTWLQDNINVGGYRRHSTEERGGVGVPRLGSIVTAVDVRDPKCERI